MFEHIIVPLDGQISAVNSLPWAKLFLDNLLSEITLLHVLEKHPPETIHGQSKHLTSAEEAKAFLENAKKVLLEKSEQNSTKVTSHVHLQLTTNVVAEIVNHLQELRANLIIMCVHGHKNLSRTFFGSIAEGVFAKGKMHVLLIPNTIAAIDEENYNTQLTLRKILVLWDGQAEHCSGVDLSLELISLFSHSSNISIEILTIMHTNKTITTKDCVARGFFPITTGIMLDMAEEQLKVNLKKLYSQMHANDNNHNHTRSSLENITINVVRGDPETQITKRIIDDKPDLVIMASHGHNGLWGLFEESLGRRLLASNKITVPVLLVPT